MIACVRKVNNAVKNSAGKYLIFNTFEDEWQNMGKVDVLINCIGIIEETSVMTFEQVHLGLTQLILKNRHVIGNPRIIQISALGADSNSQISFLNTKGKADEVLLQHINTVIVRPSIVCTPNTMMIRKLSMLKNMSKYLFGYLLFPSSFLRTCIQPIMPGDLAALIEKICFCLNPPLIIHAVGPTPLSLKKLIDKYSDSKIKIIKIPDSFFKLIFAVSSLLFPKLLSREQYQLLLTDNVYDARETEILLGRKMHATDEFWT